MTMTMIIILISTWMPAYVEYIRSTLVSLQIDNTDHPNNNCIRYPHARPTIIVFPATHRSRVFGTFDTIASSTGLHQIKAYRIEKHQQRSLRMLRSMIRRR